MQLIYFIFVFSILSELLNFFFFFFWYTVSYTDARGSTHYCTSKGPFRLSSVMSHRMATTSAFCSASFIKTLLCKLCVVRVAGRQAKLSAIQKTTKDSGLIALTSQLLTLCFFHPHNISLFLLC